MSGLLSTDRELKNHLETECASAPASTVLVGSVHRMDSAHTRVAWEELCPPKWALHKGHFRLCRLSVKLSRWEGGRLSMSFFFFLLWGKEGGGINLQGHFYAVGSETKGIKVGVCHPQG